FLVLYLPHAPPPLLYTLSLHDALPIFLRRESRRVERIPPVVLARRPPAARHRGALRRRPPARRGLHRAALAAEGGLRLLARPRPDRKSTRLNSSHLGISYAVFCLKKKK